MEKGNNFPLFAALDLFFLTGGINTGAVSPLSVPPTDPSINRSKIWYCIPK